MFSDARVTMIQSLRVSLLWASPFGLAILAVPHLGYGQPAAQQEASTDTESEATGKVLRHAVFFKFKDSSSQDDVDGVVEAFRALPSKIQEISGFQSGEHIGSSRFSDGLTHCFLLSFADDKGRAAYLPHPEHKAFGAALGPHLDKVFVIDYWGRQTKPLEKELKHAAFFKFNEGTSDEDVRAVEDLLADLPSKIDAIKAFEWGKNNSPESHDEDFTHCFMFTFDSEEGLREYAEHPAHRAAVENLIPKVEKIRVLDFWADDVPSNQSTQ
jgi:hypothetical protein